MFKKLGVTRQDAGHRRQARRRVHADGAQHRRRPAGAEQPRHRARRHGHGSRESRRERPSRNCRRPRIVAWQSPAASSSFSGSTELRLVAENWTVMKQTEVIRRPLITEKTTLLREDGRTLVFEVAPHATKVDIKRAVEKLFGAKVEAVRTAMCARQDEAPGAVRRPAVGLEEGLREAPRGREGPRVPGRGISIMPIRKYKPTSPGRRFQTVQTFDDITSTEPHKPLIEPLQRSGGRDNHGELTSWWRGGGHKRNYRVIDFKRDKRGIPATVSTIEYDPNRSARIALLTYADGEKRYILHPIGLDRRHDDRGGRQRRHPAGQLAAAEEHPARHAGAQRGAAARPRRPDRAQRGVGRPGGGQGRRVRLGQDAVGRDPQDQRRVLRDDRPGRQHRPRERVDRQGRPQPLARAAAARARRRDEPGRPPARRR